MSSSTVRIRMYCQGLGDCFLLTFPRSDAQHPVFHLLIDCGVIAGTEFAREKINAVVEDIFQTTKGHLDLVVGTHEHWDHLSGFNQARELFKKFSIDNVWLGWTEDPKDPKDLIKNRAAKVNALKKAVHQMESSSAVSSGMAAQQSSIRQILGFFGEEPGSDLGAAAGSPPTTRDAMDFLSKHPEAEVTYCYPSKPPMALEGVEGVRVYVFGPPEDPKYLKMSNPSKNAKTYGITAIGGEDSFFAALSAPKDGTRYSDLRDLTFPFEEPFRIAFDEAERSEQAEFFEANYGFAKGDPQEWRRIEGDWLDVTSELALNLDSDTNNTSLVLAFELGKPGSGQVLLFAADAQVGNWLSWKDLAWNIDAGGQTALTQTAHQLLARTVVYKVGHHGSHNATLSQLGLDLMTSENLIAMLPVDAGKAKDKGWDEMPFQPLLDTLAEKTQGRILRVDDPGLPLRPAGSHLNEKQWQQFIDALAMRSANVPSVGEQKIYVEYLLTYEG